MRINDCSAIFNLEKHRRIWMLFLIALSATVIWRMAPEASPVLAQENTKVNPQDGLTYVWIPPGTFMMGCSAKDAACKDRDDERPSHEVTISKGFWIGQTEVTVGAYQSFAAARKRQMPVAPSFDSSWVNTSMPIAGLSWNDADAYCSWAGGRLPSEAEWEYAARGPGPGPSVLDQVAWYNFNSGSQAHAVGQKDANGFGLHDMLGNVSEWVNDWYDKHYYQNSPSQDPPGPARGQDRVVRGGSWGSNPGDVRVSRRVRSNPGNGYHYIVGVRCGGDVFPPP
jgi:formylglycine-generating enzyme required for sulfatase activity